MNESKCLSLLDAEVARLKLLRAFVACYALPQPVDLSLRRMSQRMEISATTHVEIRPPLSPRMVGLGGIFPPDFLKKLSEKCRCFGEDFSVGGWLKKLA